LLIFIYLFLKLHLKKFSYSRLFWDTELYLFSDVSLCISLNLFIYC